jgi:predicted RNase H-like HicB family nuclease
MKYLVEIDLGEPGQIPFGASIPLVPGCYTTGSTLDELKSNLLEALEGITEANREAGLPIPEPATEFVLQIVVPV